MIIKKIKTIRLMMMMIIIIIAIMIMMIKIIRIIAVVIIINSPFPPGNFSTGSTTGSSSLSFKKTIWQSLSTVRS